MKSGRSSQHVAIVGGGIAGLSSAVHLAAKGVNVTIFEKNGSLGGKLNVWRNAGFVFDTGPHVLTMLFAFQRLFDAAGEQFEDSVDLIKLNTICRYHFPDNKTFDAPSDPTDAAEAIDRTFPGEKPGFLRFLQHSSHIYAKTVDTFLSSDISAAMRQGGPLYAARTMSEFLSLRPFETLDACVRRHFTDERLRQIFRVYALYSGSHPKRCSSVFSSVAHVQWSLGTYYVTGGLYKVVEAIEALFVKLGVRTLLNREVIGVSRTGNLSSGIKLTANDGEKRFFDGVICNQDVLSSGELFGRKDMTASYEPSTSAFLILAGVRGTYPSLAHHNSFLSGDESGEYEDLFDKKLPPSDPTIGVSHQSTSDPSRAPSGMSNLFIMANVPALGPEFSWTPENIAQYRRKIIDKLERSGLRDLSTRIDTEQLWTPCDFAVKYKSARGALYGLSSNGWKQAFLRPSQTSKHSRKLFFAGGSTHPGGGLPLCVLSGQIAAEQLLKKI